MNKEEVDSKIQKVKDKISSSQHKKQADFILRNAKVADVFNLVWRKADIVVKNEMIVAIDEEGKFEALEEEDAKGQHVIPGLIDTHIHIESTLLPPSEFSRVILPFGVTTAITDPHEIANVAGTLGVQYMLLSARQAEMDIYTMVPSSVPAASFEHAGAKLDAEAVGLFMNEYDVLGLAEVMDYEAFFKREDDILKKIVETKNLGKLVDGHAAELTKTQIRGYRAAGIHTDHESISAKEASIRVQQGMYVLMREGSAAKNVLAILPAVTATNARRFCFCTDDKHVDELMKEGSINHAVSIAIEAGMEPLLAIQIATLNAAECYKLNKKGALAEGYLADFVLLKDLKKCESQAVWKSGKKVAENGKMLTERKKRIPVPHSILHSVKLPLVKKEDLAIPLNPNEQVHIIEIIPNELETKLKVEKVPVKKNEFAPSPKDDLLKLAVIERHHNLNCIGKGIVKGIGIKRGAIATTFAHDSHNLIVCGTNDEDMLLAIDEINKIQGGYAITADGEVLSSIPLPIGGLMSDLDAKAVVDKMKDLHKALGKIDTNLSFHLFITLSFLALPAIPALRLTDQGLFNTKEFKFIPLNHK
ncbi:adenine deaminase [Rummeliibacillus stabekisii]|uniref:adenine deaminase n=1 Tax=Rummeliibacillus stabekisii TaxID=241244 RepID=UPI00203EF50E|nr:adenine deaminase [Rummeliibacillus stabekisii]MCM3316336.1 adenine deaminase [Rummeliibacillus stabekisii]